MRHIVFGYQTLAFEKDFARGRTNFIAQVFWRALTIFKSSSGRRQCKTQNSTVIEAGREVFQMSLPRERTVNVCINICISVSLHTPIANMATIRFKARIFGSNAVGKGYLRLLLSTSCQSVPGCITAYLDPHPVFFYQSWGEEGLSPHFPHRQNTKNVVPRLSLLPNPTETLAMQPNAWFTLRENETRVCDTWIDILGSTAGNDFQITKWPPIWCFSQI